MTVSNAVTAAVAYELPLSHAAERTPHTMNHRHRPVAARPPPPVLLCSSSFAHHLLFLGLLLLCASLPRCCLCSTVVGTWVHLSIDPSTAPTSGFCDQWVGVDSAHERLIMVGGDDGDETGPQGTWMLDYSQSFQSPVWLNLSIDLSSATAIDSPYIGGGPQGALASSPALLARSGSGVYTANQPELIVWGGHSLVNVTFFNAAYEASLGGPDGETAVWSDESGLTAAMPKVAWATSAWGDVNETLLFMYGGTVAPAGVDSSDLWLLNLSESNAVWRNITGLSSGDHPRPLSGCRMQFDPVGNQLVLMGGYSCTADFASGLGGGSSCFSNSVWLMSLHQSSMYEWTEIADPNPGPSSTWPSARAWHSTVLFGQQLWVFGGQYQDASATVYFLNDVQVFDLQQRTWQPTNIKGAKPPVMWSQTSSLVLSPDDGIWHMVTIGGCSQSVYYPDVYILKLNTAVTADNCELTGAGLESTTAGVPAYFLIQTRVALNISNSSTPSSTGAQSGHLVVFGAILTYGVQLDFDVLVIGQVGGVSTQVSSSIEELGNGLYNVSYTAFGGVATSCGNVSEPAKVTISITLDGQYLPDTPFNVPVLPSTFVPAQTSVTGETNAVQGKEAYITIQPADAYGNVAQGALNASRLVIEVDGQPLPLTAISTDSEGVYEVEYVAPEQSQYSLSVLLDGEPVSGSPFTISPLANMDISTSEETGMRVLAGLASLCLLAAMAFLYRTRGVAKVKAASPLFLFFILVGCQLALIGVLLPVAQQPSSHSSTCGAYAFTLSVGFTLAVSSLVVKTWRIARIFDRRKIRVRVITDRTLLVPVAAVVTIDLVLNCIWLGVDPLLPSDFVSSSNALLHYTACSSTNTLLWYSLMFVPKGMLLAYGVVLASQVRNVPVAFNESKWIGLAVYNIAFCSIILLAILLLLTGSPASVYVIRSIGVIWCVLATGGLMLLPKLNSEAIVDPAVPSSSEHKRTTSDGVTSGNQANLKSYESSPSTVRGMKPNSQQVPLSINAADGLYRTVTSWQKSTRAAPTPPSSKAASHRTIVNGEFKWEPNAATSKQPLTARGGGGGGGAGGGDEPSLPLVAPLHSPRSKRTLPHDGSSDNRARLHSPAGAEAERVIAQLRTQLSALSAVIDAITLNTPIHTEHGLALASHSIYAAAPAASTTDAPPPTAPVPAVATESGRGSEQADSITAALLPASTDSAAHPLSAPPPSVAAVSQSELSAEGHSAARAAFQSEWTAYEAAALSRLEAHKATGTSEQRDTDTTAAAAAAGGVSDTTPPLSVLLSHPVCVALLKVELSEMQSVHLLQFVLHCQRYRSLQTLKLRRAVAGRLYAAFLSSSAQQRIELSEPLLSAIVAALQHTDEQLCSVQLFDDAEVEVGGAMKRKLIPRLMEHNNSTLRRCQTVLQMLPWPTH